MELGPVIETTTLVVAVDPWQLPHPAVELSLVVPVIPVGLANAIGIDEYAAIIAATTYSEYRPAFIVPPSSL